MATSKALTELTKKAIPASGDLAYIVSTPHTVAADRKVDLHDLPKAWGGRVEDTILVKPGRSLSTSGVVVDAADSTTLIIRDVDLTSIIPGSGSHVQVWVSEGYGTSQGKADTVTTVSLSGNDTIVTIAGGGDLTLYPSGDYYYPDGGLSYACWVSGVKGVDGSTDPYTIDTPGVTSMISGTLYYSATYSPAIYWRDANGSWSYASAPLGTYVMCGSYNPPQEPFQVEWTPSGTVPDNYPDPGTVWWSQIAVGVGMYQAHLICGARAAIIEQFPTGIKYQLPISLMEGYSQFVDARTDTTYYEDAALDDSAANWGIWQNYYLESTGDFGAVDYSSFVTSHSDIETWELSSNGSWGFYWPYIAGLNDKGVLSYPSIYSLKGCTSAFGATLYSIGTVLGEDIPGSELAALKWADAPSACKYFLYTGSTDRTSCGPGGNGRKYMVVRNPNSTPIDLVALPVADANYGISGTMSIQTIPASSVRWIEDPEATFDYSVGFILAAVPPGTETNDPPYDVSTGLPYKYGASLMPLQAICVAKMSDTVTVGITDVMVINAVPISETASPAGEYVYSVPLIYAQAANKNSDINFVNLDPDGNQTTLELNFVGHGYDGMGNLTTSGSPGTDGYYVYMCGASGISACAAYEKSVDAYVGPDFTGQLIVTSTRPLHIFHDLYGPDTIRAHMAGHNNKGAFLLSEDDDWGHKFLIGGYPNSVMVDTYIGYAAKDVDKKLLFRFSLYDYDGKKVRTFYMPMRPQITSPKGLSDVTAWQMQFAYNAPARAYRTGFANMQTTDAHSLWHQAACYSTVEAFEVGANGALTKYSGAAITSWGVGWADSNRSAAVYASGLPIWKIE